MGNLFNPQKRERERESERERERERVFFAALFTNSLSGHTTGLQNKNYYSFHSVNIITLGGFHFTII